MDVIVDRIEEGYVIVEIEKGKTSKIGLDLVPSVKEGDVISIIINEDKTEERRKIIEQLMDDVFE